MSLIFSGAIDGFLSGIAWINGGVIICLCHDRGCTTRDEPLMYEHHSKPLLPPRAFLRRVLGHVTLAAAILLVSLGIGVAGYHWTEGFSLLDSLLNASMILGGMGPVDSLRTDAGRVFASCYALFSGVIFLASVGIIIAPIAHRIMHRLHLSADAGG